MSMLAGYAGVKTFLWLDSAPLVKAVKAWVWPDSAPLVKAVDAWHSFRGYPMGADQYDSERTKQEGILIFGQMNWPGKKRLSDF